MPACQTLAPALRMAVMGPTAAGKSTLGTALAVRYGIDFVDADDLHPQANVEKMRRGEPLTDDDRWPWLDRVADEIAEAARAGLSLVLACSALRRSYRARLRRGDPQLLFLCLTAPQAVLAARAAGRGRHFMPATLVASQCATLERPAPDEGAVMLDARQPLEALLDTVSSVIRSRP